MQRHVTTSSPSGSRLSVCVPAQAGVPTSDFRVLCTPLYSDNGGMARPWKPGEALPTSLLVLKSGDNATNNKGIFKVNALTAQQFDATQRKHGRDRVTIDFEHNTLEGSPAYNLQTAEPRMVAGRGREAIG